MEEPKKGTKEKIFECPHCYEPIRVVVQTQIVEVAILGDQMGNIDWTAGLTKEQLEILKFAESNGILKAFGQVVNIANAHNMPKSLERFFLGFIKTALPKTIPGFALKKFIEMFQQKRVVFLAAQGIGVVLASGKIRLFIPSDYVLGRSIQGGKLKLRTSANEDDFLIWLQNRWGFVAAETQADMLGFIV